MESLRGHLLIANGNLFDPNFRHTVVLVAEHNADGALGVVLNRPLDVPVSDAAPLLAPLVAAREVLYQGGPVQPYSPVVAAELVRPEVADVPVFGGVGLFLGRVPAEFTGDVIRARVFAGYSGWDAGQLEREMDEDSWIIDPAREEDIFTNAPDLLWSRVLVRKGPEYRRLSRVPFDPSMN